MAPENKINLIKIKKHLSSKNFKVGGFINFESDASDKVFKLCKTANKKLLLLSFQNKPNDFKKYVKATEVLIKQKVNTPSIVDLSRSHKFVIMDYFPTTNAARYFKKNYMKQILPLATQSIINLQNTKKKISGIKTKPHSNLLNDAIRGIRKYIQHYERKIEVGFYLNKLIVFSLKKNTEKQQKYKPVLTHGDFFLENLIYYKRLLYVIDHQDLHYNHPHLDIASLIFDARRSYSQITEERLMRIYAKKQNINLKEFKENIHLVSLLRNLRILGNWVQLFDTGKPKYLKKYRRETWKQIFKHVEYLRFWDLREIFMDIYKKTK